MKTTCVILTPLDDPRNPVLNQAVREICGDKMPCMKTLSLDDSGQARVHVITKESVTKDEAWCLLLDWINELHE